MVTFRSSPPAPVTVGSHPANGVGLHDRSGNVVIVTTDQWRASQTAAAR
jgi:hypothetical protein